MAGHGQCYCVSKIELWEIRSYAQMRLPVHITELDVDVLPAAFEYMGAETSTSFECSDELNPYPD